MLLCTVFIGSMLGLVSLWFDVRRFDWLSYCQVIVCVYLCSAVTLRQNGHQEEEFVLEIPELLDYLGMRWNGGV